uniref:Uncharacterized protein n=1 Tax=Fagus sylvatica TaxID=28930 RepID=A0A2N9JAJ0_FAGSY
MEIPNPKPHLHSHPSPPLHQQQQSPPPPLQALPRRGKATAESRRYETPSLSRENTTQLGSGQSGEAFQRLGSGSGSVEAWTRELDDEDEL